MLEKFGLIVKHSKTEIFHFNRSQGTFNPPSLGLSPLGGSILWPNNSWKYLGFIFDRKLTFHQHVDFYANKSISTVKCMNILGNSNCGINPLQKQLLYKTCVLPIMLYRFQLWFYNQAPITYHLKTLGKMQRRVAIWILRAFKTFPSYGIEAIAGLIPINSTSKNLEEDHNYKYTNYLLIILYAPLWILNSALSPLITPFLSIPLPINRGHSSKAI